MKSKYLFNIFCGILLIVVAYLFLAPAVPSLQFGAKNKPYSATNTALAAKFEQLSKNGNSSCSGVFKDSIASMPDSNRLQGSCCSPMSMHRYSEQVKGLEKYKNIPEIPSDPYDIDAKIAKQMITNYDMQLTPTEQQAYDYAMQNSMEKGPCCC